MAFAQDVYEVDEDGGSTDVCVELSQAIEPIEDALWLNFTSQDDTAFSKFPTQQLIDGLYFS